MFIMDHSFKALAAHEIQDILEKASLFGGKVSQLNPSSSLESLIKRIDIDFYGTMTITLFDELAFERDRPIAIAFNYRDLSFYLSPTQYAYKGDVLIADSPTGAKALAVRDHERYVLPLDTKIMSSIYRIERRGSDCNLNAHLVDVSDCGMGLIIHNAEEEAVLQHDHVWIKVINDIQLVKPIFGKIIYVTNRKFKDGIVDSKLGISLEEKIPEDILTELKRLSRITLF